MERKKNPLIYLFKKYETRLKSIFVLHVHEVIKKKQNADLDLYLPNIFAYYAINA